ncbi:fimbrial protein [Klebsiella aerogenes]
MDRKYTNQAGTIVPAMMALLLSAGIAQANPDNWEVEGEHGELHVSGALTEGACRLDMASAYQEVLMGSTPNALLRHPGSQGTPITFHLQLRDCQRNGGRKRDVRTDTLTWDPLQSVVSVRFIAPADASMPSLVKVSGVTGVGLLLKDSHLRDIRLGDTGVPQFVGAASDELIYTVTPVRTPESLTTGEYRATVDFQLSYD